MFCTNMDLVESFYTSFLNVGKVQIGSFVTWRQFSQKVIDNLFSI